MAEIEVRTLVMQTTTKLRQEVLDGRLEPGARVRQEDVASRLGVSRTPLREAFRQLTAEGWFENHPRQGVIVANLTAQEATEISIARLVLEPAATRMAAVVHDGEAEKRLIALVEQHPGDAVDLPAAEFQAVNSDFHLELYGIGPESEPTELGKLTEHTWQKFARYRRYYWRDRQHVSLSVKTHRRIAELWCARDGEAAEAALAEHILHAIVDQIHILSPVAEPDPALLQIARRYGLDHLFSQPVA